jgi:hypothetical protein
VVSSLAAIIPVLGEDQRDAVLKEALTVTFSLWDEKPNAGLMGEVSARLKALTTLAPYLSGDLNRERGIQCRERLGGLLRYYHQEAARKAARCFDQTGSGYVGKFG